MELIWREVGAVFEDRICLKSALGNRGGVGFGDIGEQRNDIEADYDVVWLEGAVLNHRQQNCHSSARNGPKFSVASRVKDICHLLVVFCLVHGHSGVALVCSEKLDLVVS